MTRMKGFVTAVAVVLGSVLVLAIGVALAVWVLLSVGAFDAPAEPATSSGTEAPVADGIPSRPAEAFPLTVRYVFDGDTIEAQATQPNTIVTTTEPVRIRLIGVDTPEGTPTPECWADEARAHLREHLPEGTTVWSAPDTETSDRYGRYLFNLWSDDGRFINHELVAAGDAEAIRVGSNDAFYDLLTDAQTQAQASGAGRWAACG